MDGLSTTSVALLASLFFLAAALYSSVGHAGASAYLAAMILAGVPPAIMKPTAFTLNILVASLVGWRFARAGYFRWRLLWPAAALSIPAAFAGTLLPVVPVAFKAGLALALAAGAAHLALASEKAPPLVTIPFSIPGAMLAGGMVGLLSGITGTGGGIFLSPLYLLAGWAPFREVAATSSFFILANSLAGLAGTVLASQPPPPAILAWLPAVALGGWVGSSLGLGRLAPVALRRLLAVVMLVACLKLLAG